MLLGRLFRPTNRRIRLLVGLFLAGLFCIQCTTSDTFRSSKLVFAISVEDAGKDAPQVQAELEKLARKDHVALLDRCLTNYRSKYRDFRCTFIKQERIRGILSKEQWMDVKFMPKPFSVVLKWTKNIPLGEQVIYVDGKYNNMMLVKPRGILYRLAGTVKRKPDAPDVMKNTLRPVSKFGLEKATENLIRVYLQGRKDKVCKETFGGYAEVAGRKALVLVRYLPDTPDWPSYKTVTFVDLEYQIPVCIEGFDKKGELVCRYVYKDLKFNPGLTEADFLPQANEMKPPKK